MLLSIDGSERLFQPAQVHLRLGLMADNVWCVVLAAGQGRRLAAVTQGTPKQYWSGRGRRSLLDDTFERMSPLVPAARTTVVIDLEHVRFVRSGKRAWPAHRILYQPRDRGTAVGVLLAVSSILHTGNDDIVVLTPSDHGVVDVMAFRQSIRSALNAVHSGQATTILFGVEPSHPATDYGWIQPGTTLNWVNGRPLRAVTGFAEKPDQLVANRFLAAGGLWNSMVLVSRVDALYRLFEDHLLHWARAFDLYRQMSAPLRNAFLSERYGSLPSADFSRDILARSSGLAVYPWSQAVGWSDLGTPERLSRWIRGAHGETAAAWAS